MADPVDRRASERMPIAAGTSCSSVAPVGEDIGPAKIRDVSIGGVGFILTRRVEIGSLLTLGLANTSKGFAKTVLVRVAHITPVHGGFLVGGTFTVPLTYQELTALVM